MPFNMPFEQRTFGCLTCISESADTHLAFHSEADLEIASSEVQTMQQMNDQPPYMPESQATTSYPTSDVSIEAGMPTALISSPEATVTPSHADDQSKQAWQT